jgi:hypothetical protein
VELALLLDAATSITLPVSEHRILPDSCLVQAEVQQVFVSSAFVSWVRAPIAETARNAPQAVAIRVLIDISDLLFKRTARAVRASRKW